jgi:hypothetical protein
VGHLKLKQPEIFLSVCKSRDFNFSTLAELHKMLLFGYLTKIQGDFESCAYILTRGRTPQLLTIEPIMSYTNVAIFREKGTNSF